MSNTSEDEAGGRPVTLEWGSPAPPDAQRGVISTALAVSRTDVGMAASVRRVVERAVEEFKAK